jgi:CPA2 family monovalent cation:H+ antiporter-2
MHELDILRDLVILVGVAIPVVAVTQRFRIPTVVGFLLTGLAIGPHSLGIIHQTEEVAGLAELGVVLLLFTIGLELSLSRIIRLGRPVLQGGTVQLIGTAVVFGVLAAWAGLDAPRATFFGALLALSSTAVVLKLYNDRRELDLSHGRIVVAILLFQDLCVVPLMLLTPVLAGADAGVGAALRATLVSLAVVGALIVGGRFAIPWVLERVVGVQNREIFTLSIVFIGLGAAFVTATFGLSLALGAFIAGLLISESEYGLQALSDALPFRDSFTGIFFISVGMLVDPDFVLQHLGLVLGLTVGVILLKGIVGTLAARSLGRSLQLSIVAGFSIAQVGEFSFVLASVGIGAGLLSDDAYQTFLAISVLSMLVTPLLIAGAPAFADAVGRWLRLPALRLTTREYQAVQQLRDHVIIVGYGLNGRNLARVLKAANIRYVILEQNGQTVRRARMNREPIFFGDGTRRGRGHCPQSESGPLHHRAHAVRGRARRTAAAWGEPRDSGGVRNLNRDLQPRPRSLRRPQEPHRARSAGGTWGSIRGVARAQFARPASRGVGALRRERGGREHRHRTRCCRDRPEPRHAQPPPGNRRHGDRGGPEWRRHPRTRAGVSVHGR